jgi:hypothetical protein
MMQLPKPIRASDRDLFKCPAQWFITRAYPEEMPKAVWFPKGTAIHSGIEQMIGGESLQLAIAYAQLEVENLDAELWSKTDPDQVTLDQSVVNCLTTWYNQVHPESKERNPEYTNLAWPPRTEVKVEGEIGGNSYCTTIDAIFGADEVDIVDWKSGASRSDSVQLWIYQYLVTKLMGLKVRSSWFHNVHLGKIQMADPYPGDAVVATLLDAVANIKYGYAYPPLPDWYCNYCVARSKCPLFGGDTNLSPSNIEWVTETGEEK